MALTLGTTGMDSGTESELRNAFATANSASVAESMPVVPSVKAMCR